MIVLAGPRWLSRQSAEVNDVQFSTASARSWGGSNCYSSIVAEVANRWHQNYTAFQMSCLWEGFPEKFVRFELAIGHMQPTIPACIRETVKTMPFMTMASHILARCTKKRRAVRTSRPDGLEKAAATASTGSQRKSRAEPPVEDNGLVLLTTRCCAKAPRSYSGCGPGPWAVDASSKC